MTAVDTTRVLKKTENHDHSAVFAVEQDGHLYPEAIYLDPTAYRLFKHQQQYGAATAVNEMFAVRAMIGDRNFRRDGNVRLGPSAVRAMYGIPKPEEFAIEVQCGPYLVNAPMAGSQCEARLRAGNSEYVLQLRVTKALDASQLVRDEEDVASLVEQKLHAQLESGWLPVNGQELEISLR